MPSQIGARNENSDCKTNTLLNRKIFRHPPVHAGRHNTTTSYKHLTPLKRETRHYEIRNTKPIETKTQNAHNFKWLTISPTSLVCSPAISAPHILISQPTQTPPPPRITRIPVTRSQTRRARTPIRLIILPLPIRLIIVFLLLPHSRPITSSRARGRIVACSATAARTRRRFMSSPASVFAGLLGQDFLFFFLASFSGCFFGGLLCFL